ncbi:hypothetical protein BC937DRAFT_90424 [Endogone sp. FLAS-F59071]|nr:hypothetical protein BC937DRAFT_90424 [Endogone sp. FLAS-F59071]|eukprot:RUS22093.1 hypothetical protein BC937DRAFT_90424 [Endogone sp. FLAS-F59071]
MVTTLILYWTPYHSNATHWNSRAIDQCGLPYTCQLTHDRARLFEARAVVFHAPEMRFDDLPAQGESPWVVHMKDPPTEVKWVHEEEKLRLFQHSMTYRLDSTFPSSPLPPTFFADSLRPPSVSWSERNHVPIVWVNGDCTAPNGRHHYVRELMRWIDVDVYGGCLANKAWPPDTTLEHVISTYKFHLVLEPSNCANYLHPHTLLATTLRAGAVPLVDGPRDYTPFSPHTDALIQLDDFSSPRALATRLTELAKDEKLYAAHLRYKEGGGATVARKFTSLWNKTGAHNGPNGGWGYDETSAWCRLCRTVVEGEKEDVAAKRQAMVVVMSERPCVARKHLVWRRGFVGVRDVGIEVGVPGQWALGVVVAGLIVVMARKSWRMWVRDMADYITGYEEAGKPRQGGKTRID